MLGQKRTGQMVNRYRLVLVTAWAFALPLCRPAPTERLADARVQPLITTLPLAFEVNSGQAPHSVRFLAHDLTQAVTLHRSEVRLYVSNPKTGKGAALSLELRGGRSRATLVALMPLPGVHNHFHGADRAHWRTGVPTYARVRYRGIYPGVDLDFYGDQGRLEYDFIIGPFADPG